MTDKKSPKETKTEEHRFLSFYMEKENQKPRKLLTAFRRAFSEGKFNDSVHKVNIEKTYGTSTTGKNNYYDYLILDPVEFEKWLDAEFPKEIKVEPLSVGEVLNLSPEARKEYSEKMRKMDASLVKKSYDVQISKSRSKIEK